MNDRFKEAFRRLKEKGISHVYITEDLDMSADYPSYGAIIIPADNHTVGWPLTVLAESVFCEGPEDDEYCDMGLQIHYAAENSDLLKKYFNEYRLIKYSID